MAKLCLTNIVIFSDLVFVLKGVFQKRPIGKQRPKFGFKKPEIWIWKGS